ncbi:MAG: NAD(P)-dependent oxidoreductase [Holosporales bacterium]|nr:NAD(P)-dependent oxidoreductase [Holosporales bacterium]
MSAELGCVLVTGGTGSIGRCIVEALCAAGRSVRVVARPRKEKPFAGLGNLLEVVETSDVFSESGDWWKQVYRGVGTVVHVAWVTDPERQHMSSLDNVDCLAGTLQMGQWAIESGVRRFVGIGTFREYDACYGAFYSTETPLQPVTLYDSAKISAFYVLRDLFGMSETEFAWCRIFSLCGEDARHCLAARISSRIAMGEPMELTEGVSDFWEVSDAGRRIAEVALGSEQGAVNICSGVPKMVRSLAEDIADGYGRRDLLRFYPQRRDSSMPLVVVGSR